MSVSTVTGNSPSGRAWAAVVCWAALVLLFSSIPLPEVEKSLPGVDKVVHFLEYLVLGMLAAKAFLSSGSGAVRRNAFGLTIIGCVLFGFIDELHQRLIPGRSMDLLDFLADSAGAFVGAWMKGLLPLKTVKNGGKNE